MAVNPKQISDDTNLIINAWNTLAPAASFGGMTLAQYKTKVQPSFDTRTQLDTLDAQVTAATDARDNPFHFSLAALMASNSSQRA